MAIIIFTIIIMYIVLILWAYHSLESIENTKKILYIFGLILIIYVLTYITFGISKNDIEYTNENIMSYVKNILVFIFTGINGLFVIPFLGRGLDALEQEHITKEQLLKKVGLSIGILFILLILECGYMTNTQKGILNVMNNKM